jgi:DnaJ-class molecular chaperone
VRMTLPPGTQSGKKLRLRGRGMPSLRGQAGDFYVVAQIQVPPASEGAREAAQRLEAFYGGDLRAGLHL